MIRRLLAILAIVAGAHAVGHLVGCGAFQDGVQANDPHDDANMYDCRLFAKADFGVNNDAGGAWKIYDACMKDAGYR